MERGAGRKSDPAPGVLLLQQSATGGFLGVGHTGYFIGPTFIQCLLLLQCAFACAYFCEVPRTLV